MSNKIRIGVLGSTKGTDLQAVIDAIEKKELNAEISIVISNKKDAFILERAKSHGVKSVFLDPKVFSSREEYDKEISKHLENENAELILLIGYMKIITDFLCKKYKNKIINIHPSLLPLFAGEMDTNVHEEVKKQGLKETGCTLHFVTSKVDSGPIIFQEKVAVNDADTAEEIKNNVQKAEQKVILKAIKLFADNKINIVNGLVKINE